MDKIKCNHCGNVQTEEELLIIDDIEACTKCQKTDALMDIQADPADEVEI